MELSDQHGPAEAVMLASRSNGFSISWDLAARLLRKGQQRGGGGGGGGEGGLSEGG